jgi:enoyl-CoA hydratase
VDEPTVLVEKRGGIGLLTLNRPAKLNALNTQLVSELEAGLRQFEADDEVNAIVLTGAGERAFSAGGDMKEQREQIDARTIGQRRSASQLLRPCRKPVLAAIRGYAYGGGALLAVACDIRIAASDARFKFHGASYGQAPGGAMLPRILGDAKAKELLFTGDIVEAPEALRIGLVNQVVEPEDVLTHTLAMAERIAANSPAAVQTIKRTIDAALPNDAALELEHRENQAIRASTDSASRFKAAAERVVGA